MDKKDRCIRPRLSIEETETIIVFLRHALNMHGMTDVTSERINLAGDLCEKFEDSLLRFKMLEQMRQTKEYYLAIEREKQETGQTERF